MLPEEANGKIVLMQDDYSLQMLSSFACELRRGPPGVFGDGCSFRNCTLLKARGSWGLCMWHMAWGGIQFVDSTTFFP